MREHVTSNAVSSSKRNQIQHPHARPHNVATDFGQMPLRESHWYSNGIRMTSTLGYSLALRRRRPICGFRLVYDQLYRQLARWAGGGHAPMLLTTIPVTSTSYEY